MFIDLRSIGGGRRGSVSVGASFGVRVEGGVNGRAVARSGVNL